ncbi:MAG: methyltransferase domain-containing protein [Candidatus Omnitrophica bacterium]|nr:methyltransferase domain-containing protein [Candidatus Omnitrophota bacterium]
MALTAQVDAISGTAGTKVPIGTNYAGPDRDSYGRNFGATAWNDHGLGVLADKLRSDLREMRGHKLDFVRMTLFADGRAFFNRRSSLLRRYADNHTFRRDVKELLSSMRDAGMGVSLYLFDHILVHEGKSVNGVDLQGKKALVTDDKAYTAFEEGLLVPFLKEFGSDPAITAFELYNEIDQTRGHVDIRQLGTFLVKLSKTIRKNAPGKPVKVSVNTEAEGQEEYIDLCVQLHKMGAVDSVALHHYADRFGARARDVLMSVIKKLNDAGVPWSLEEFATKKDKDQTGPEEYLDIVEKNGGRGMAMWNWVPGLDDRTFGDKGERDTYMKRLGMGLKARSGIATGKSAKEATEDEDIEAKKEIIKRRLREGIPGMDWDPNTAPWMPKEAKSPRTPLRERITWIKAYISYWEENPLKPEAMKKLKIEKIILRNLEAELSGRPAERIPLWGKQPEAAPAKAPEAVPAKAPEAVPAKAPEAVPAKAPEAVPAKAPEAAPAKAPEAVPPKGPEAAPVKTPEAAPAKTPEVLPAMVPGSVTQATPSIAEVQQAANPEITTVPDRPDLALLAPDKTLVGKPIPTVTPMDFPDEVAKPSFADVGGVDLGNGDIRLPCGVVVAKDGSLRLPDKSTARVYSIADPMNNTTRKEIRYFDAMGKLMMTIGETEEDVIDVPSKRLKLASVTFFDRKGKDSVYRRLLAMNVDTTDIYSPLKPVVGARPGAIQEEQAYVKNQDGTKTVKTSRYLLKSGEEYYRCETTDDKDHKPLKMVLFARGDLDGVNDEKVDRDIQMITRIESITHPTFGQVMQKTEWFKFGARDPQLYAVGLYAVTPKDTEGHWTWDRIAYESYVTPEFLLSEQQKSGGDIRWFFESGVSPDGMPYDKDTTLFFDRNHEKYVKQTVRTETGVELSYLKRTDKLEKDKMKPGQIVTFDGMDADVAGNKFEIKDGTKYDGTAFTFPDGTVFKTDLREVYYSYSLKRRQNPVTGIFEIYQIERRITDRDGNFLYINVEDRFEREMATFIFDSATAKIHSVIKDLDTGAVKATMRHSNRKRWTLEKAATNSVATYDRDGVVTTKPIHSVMEIKYDGTRGVYVVEETITDKEGEKEYTIVTENDIYGTVVGIGKGTKGLYKGKEYVPVELAVTDVTTDTKELKGPDGKQMAVISGGRATFRGFFRDMEFSCEVPDGAKWKIQTERYPGEHTVVKAMLSDMYDNPLFMDITVEYANGSKQHLSQTYDLVNSEMTKYFEEKKSGEEEWRMVSGTRSRLLRPATSSNSIFSQFAARDLGGDLYLQGEKVFRKGGEKVTESMMFDYRRARTKLLTRWDPLEMTSSPDGNRDVYSYDLNSREKNTVMLKGRKDPRGQVLPLDAPIANGQVTRVFVSPAGVTEYYLEFDEWAGPVKKQYTGVWGIDKTAPSSRMLKTRIKLKDNLYLSVELAYDAATKTYSAGRAFLGKPIYITQFRDDSLLVRDIAEINIKGITIDPVSGKITGITDNNSDKRYETALKEHRNVGEDNFTVLADIGYDDLRAPSFAYVRIRDPLSRDTGKIFRVDVVDERMASRAEREVKDVKFLGNGRIDNSGEKPVLFFRVKKIVVPSRDRGQAKVTKAEEGKEGAQGAKGESGQAGQMGPEGETAEAGEDYVFTVPVDSQPGVFKYFYGVSAKDPNVRMKIRGTVNEIERNGARDLEVSQPEVIEIYKVLSEEMIEGAKTIKIEYLLRPPLSLLGLAQFAEGHSYSEILDYLIDQLKNNWDVDYLKGWVTDDINMLGSKEPVEGFRAMYEGASEKYIQEQWKKMKQAAPYIITAKLIAIGRILDQSVRDGKISREIADDKYYQINSELASLVAWNGIKTPIPYFNSVVYERHTALPGFSRATGRNLTNMVPVLGWDAATQKGVLKYHISIRGRQLGGNDEGRCASIYMPVEELLEGVKEDELKVGQDGTVDLRNWEFVYQVKFDGEEGRSAFLGENRIIANGVEASCANKGWSGDVGRHEGNWVNIKTGNGEESTGFTINITRGNRENNTEGWITVRVRPGFQKKVDPTRIAELGMRISIGRGSSESFEGDVFIRGMMLQRIVEDPEQTVFSDNSLGGVDVINGAMRVSAGKVPDQRSLLKFGSDRSTIYEVFPEGAMGKRLTEFLDGIDPDNKLGAHDNKELLTAVYTLMKERNVRDPLVSPEIMRTLKAVTLVKEVISTLAGVEPGSVNTDEFIAKLVSWADQTVNSKYGDISDEVKAISDNPKIKAAIEVLMGKYALEGVTEESIDKIYSVIYEQAVSVARGDTVFATKAKSVRRDQAVDQVVTMVNLHKPGTLTYMADDVDEWKTFIMDISMYGLALALLLFGANILRKNVGTLRKWRAKPYTEPVLPLGGSGEAKPVGPTKGPSAPAAAPGPGVEKTARNKGVGEVIKLIDKYVGRRAKKATDMGNMAKPIEILWEAQRSIRPSTAFGITVIGMASLGIWLAGFTGIMVFPNNNLWISGIVIIAISLIWPERKEIRTISVNNKQWKAIERQWFPMLRWFVKELLASPVSKRAKYARAQAEAMKLVNDNLNEVETGLRQLIAARGEDDPETALMRKLVAENIKGIPMRVPLPDVNSLTLDLQAYQDIFDTIRIARIETTALMNDALRVLDSKGRERLRWRVWVVDEMRYKRMLVQDLEGLGWRKIKFNQDDNNINAGTSGGFVLPGFGDEGIVQGSGAYAERLETKPNGALKVVSSRTKKESKELFAHTVPYELWETTVLIENLKGYTDPLAAKKNRAHIAARESKEHGRLGSMAALQTVLKRHARTMLVLVGILVAVSHAIYFFGLPALPEVLSLGSLEIGIDKSATWVNMGIKMFIVTGGTAFMICTMFLKPWLKSNGFFWKETRTFVTDDEYKVAESIAGEDQQSAEEAQTGAVGRTMRNYHYVYINGYDQIELLRSMFNAVPTPPQFAGNPTWADKNSGFDAALLKRIIERLRGTEAHPARLRPEALDFIAATGILNDAAGQPDLSGFAADRGVIDNREILEALHAELGHEGVVGYARILATDLDVMRPCMPGPTAGSCAERSIAHGVTNGEYPADRFNVSLATIIPLTLGGMNIVPAGEAAARAVGMDPMRVMTHPEPVPIPNQPGQQNQPLSKPSGTNMAYSEIDVDFIEGRRALPEIWEILDEDNEPQKFHYWTVTTGYERVKSVVACLTREMLDETEEGEVVAHPENILPSNLIRRNKALYDEAIRWNIDLYAGMKISKEYDKYSKMAEKARPGDPVGDMMVKIFDRETGVYKSKEEYIFEEMREREGPSVMQGIPIQMPYGLNKSFFLDYNGWGPVKFGLVAPRTPIAIIATILGIVLGLIGSTLTISAFSLSVIVLANAVFLPIIGYYGAFIFSSSLVRVARERGWDFIMRMAQTHTVFHLDGLSNWFESRSMLGYENDGTRTARGKVEDILEAARVDVHENLATAEKGRMLIMMAELSGLKPLGMHPRDDTTEDKALGMRVTQRGKRVYYYTDMGSSVLEQAGPMGFAWHGQRSRWIMIVSSAAILGASFSLTIPIFTYGFAGIVGGILGLRTGIAVGLTGTLLGAIAGLLLGYAASRGFTLLLCRLGFIEQPEQVENRIKQIGWGNFFINILLDSGFTSTIFTALSFAVTFFYFLAFVGAEILGKVAVFSGMPLSSMLARDSSGLSGLVHVFSETMKTWLPWDIWFIASASVGVTIMMTFYFYQVYHNVTALFKNKLGGTEKISKGISDFYSDRLEEFRNDLAKVESGATGGFQQDDVTNWVTKDLKYLEDAALEITAINLRGDITPAEKKRSSRQVITMLRKWLLHGDRDFDKQKRDGGRSTFFADLLSDYYSSPALNVNGAVQRGRALIAESIRTRIGTLEAEMNKFSRGQFRPGLLTFVLGAVLVLNAVFMVQTYMFLTLMVPGVMLIGTVILFQLFKWYLPVGRMPYFYIYYISKAFYMPLYFVNLNAAARLVWYQIRNRLDNVWPYTEKVLPVGLDRLPQRIYAQQQLRPDKELWHFYSEKWDKFYLYMRHSGFRQLWTYGFAFFTILYLCFLMPAYYAKKYFGLSAVKAAPVADAFRTLITGQDMSAVQAASGGSSGLLAQIAQNHLPLVILGGAVLFALVLVLVNKRFSGERTRRHSKIQGDPDCPVVITVSGPSGVGKGTVIDGHPGRGIKGIFERYPNAQRVVSYTTRTVRPTEQDGREHRFIDRAEFEKMRDEGKFLQWIDFGGNFYGVTRDSIDEILAEGKDALIDLDAAGAAAVRNTYSDRIVDLFISPIATDRLEEGDTAGTLSKESENAVRAVLIYRILTRTFPDNQDIPEPEVIEKALNETGALPEAIRPLVDDNIGARLDSVINETKKFGEFSIVMSNVFWDQAAIIDRLISEIKAKKAELKERDMNRAAWRTRIIRRLIGLLAGLGVYFAAGVARGGGRREVISQIAELSMKKTSGEILSGSVIPFFGSGLLTGILLVIVVLVVYKFIRVAFPLKKVPAKPEPKEITIAPELERALATPTEEQIKSNPIILVFSGPSGVGKRRMLNRFAETHPNAVRVVSYTTRAPREGEVEGRDHKFISEAEFEKMADTNKFFHTVKFGDMRYGIVKDEIDSAISSGKDVIVDIDVEGAKVVRETYPGNIVDVYVSPIAIDRLTRRMPDTGRIEPAALEEATRVLKERLVREEYGGAEPGEAVIAANRGIQERMSRGVRELRRWKDFHYLVANINGNEDAAVNEVSEYYRREKITRSLKEFNFGVDSRGPPDNALADFVSMRVKQVYDSGVMPYPYDPETIQLDMGNGAKTSITYIPGRGQYKPARPTEMTEEMFRDHQEFTFTQKGARRCWACQLKKFSDYALFKSSFSEDGVPTPRKYVSWINMNVTFRDHILLATEEASPQTLNRDKLVDSLTFADNLGPEFEGFFNTRPHGSVGHFHAHYYRKSSSIWEGLDAEDGAAGKIRKKNIREIGDVEVSELDNWNAGVLLTGWSKTQIAGILSYWIDELNESVKPYIISFRVKGDGKYEVFFKPVTDNSTMTVLGVKQSGAVSYHYGNGICSSPRMWEKIQSDPKGAARDIKRWIKKTTNRSFRPERPEPDMTLKGREMELAAVGEDKAGIQDAVQARPFEMLSRLAGDPIERFFRRLFGREKGASNVVLEFGCGSGEQSNWLVSKGVNCIGVDISVRYLAKASEMAKIYGLRSLATGVENITKQWIDQAKAIASKTKKPFVVYSLIKEDGRIPLEDNSVDGVTIHRVYSTLLDDNMKRKVLSEIYRVLKPGGYFSGLDFLKIAPELSEKDENVKLRNLAISRRYAVHAEVLRRMNERGTLPEYLNADTVMRNFVASADLSRNEDALIILQKRNYSRQDWEFSKTKAAVPDVIRDMTYDEFFTEKSYTADQFMEALDAGIVSIQTVVQHVSGPRFQEFVEDSGMEVLGVKSFRYLHEGGKGWSAATSLFAEKPKTPRSRSVSGVFRFAEKDLDLISGRFEGLGTYPETISAILEELGKGLKDEEDHWFYSRIIRLTGAPDLRQNRDGKKTYYGRVPFVKEDGKRGKLINAATPVFDFDKDDTLDKGETSLSDDSARRLAAMIALGRKVGINTAKALEELRTVKNSLTGETGLELYTPLRDAMIANVSTENWDASIEDVADDILTDLFDLFLDTSATKLVPKRGARSQYELDIEPSFQAGFSSDVSAKIMDLLTYHGAHEPYMELNHALARQREILTAKGFGGYANLPEMNIYAMDLPEGHPLRAKCGPRVITKLLYRPFGYKPKPEKKTPEYEAVLEARKEVEKVLVKLFEGMHERNELGDISIIPVVAGKNAIDLNMVQVLGRTPYPVAMRHEPFAPLEIGTYQRIQKDRAIEHQAREGYVDITYHDNEALAGNGLAVTQRLMQNPIPGIDLKVVAADLNKPEELAKATIVAERYIGGGMHGKAAYREAEVLYADLARGGMAPDKIEGLYYLGGEFDEIGSYLDRAIENMSDGRKGPASAVHPFRALGAFVHAAAGITAYILLILGAIAAKDDTLVNIALWGGIPVFVLPALFHAYAAIIVFAKMWEHDREFSGGKVRWMTHLKDAMVTPIMTSKLKLTHEQINDLVGNSKDRAEKVNMLRTAASGRAYLGQPAEVGTTSLLSDDQIFALVDMTNTHNSLARSILAHEMAPSFMGMGLLTHIKAMYTMIWDYVKALHLSIELSSEANMRQFFSDRLRTYDQRYGKGFKPVTYWHSVMREARGRYREYMKDVEIVFDMGKDGSQRFVVPLPVNSNEMPEIRELLVRYLTIVLRNRMEAIGPQYVYLKYDDSVADMVKEARDAMYTDDFFPTIDAINNTYRVVRRKAMGINSEEELQIFISEEYKRLEREYLSGDRASKGELTKDESDNLKAQAEINLGGYEFQFIRAVTREELSRMDSIKAKGIKVRRENMQEARDLNLKGLKNIAPGDFMAGVDVGGSDVKLLLYKGKDIIFYKKYNWAPENFTKGSTEHVDTMRDLIYIMELKAILSQRTQPDQELDVLEKEIDSVSYRSDVSSAENEAASEASIVKIRSIIERAGENEYIKSRLYSASGEKQKILAGVGISWPDIIVDNLIVGGDTAKTKGLTKEEFNEIVTPMADTLKISLGGVPVVIKNDGDVGAFWASVELNRGNVLALALGTSLAGGYVPHSGVLGNLRTYASRMIIDMRKDNEVSYEKFPGTPTGIAALYLSQKNIMILAKEKGLDLGPVKSAGRAQQLKYVQKILNENLPGADIVREIYDEMGLYMASFLAEISDYYDHRDLIRTVVVTGRCFESPEGNRIMLGNGRDKGRIHRVLNDSYPEIADLEIMLAEELAGNDPSVNAFAQAMGAAYLANQEVTRLRNAEQAQGLAGTSVESMVIGVETDSTQAELDKYMASTGLGSVKVLALPKGNEKEENMGILDTYRRQHNLLWAGMADQQEIGGRRKLRQAIGALVRQIEINETRLFLKKRAEDIKALTIMTPETVEEIARAKGVWKEILGEIKLPVMMAEINDLSMYNFNLCDIADKTLTKLDTGTMNYIDDVNKQPGIVEMTVGSLGEARIQAESFRLRNPKKLKLVLTVAMEDSGLSPVDAAALDADIAKLNSDKDAILKKMGIDSILRKDDLTIIKRSEHDQAVENKMIERVQQYGKGNVAVVDMISKTRRERRMPEGAIYMEYNDIATSEVLDATLKLLSVKGDKAKVTIKGLTMNAFGHFIFVRKIEAINIEELKNEFKRYQEILTRA